MKEILEAPEVQATGALARLDRLVDWRRLLVFAGGGALLLLLMLSAADRMRERAALQSVGLMQESPYAVWVGEWVGSLKTSAPDGTVVAQVRSTRRFGEFDGASQKLEWREARATGVPLNRPGQQTMEGRLLVRTIRAEAGQEVFRGRLDDSGTITWTSETPEGLTLLREWVDGETYYVEGFSLQKGVADSIVYHSGRLRRERPPQTAPK